MNLDTFDRKRAGLLDIAAWLFLLVGPTVLMSALSSFYLIDLIAEFLYMLTFVLLITKDIFNGHSVFKLSHGIKIVDSSTEHPVSETRTVLRNSTLILLFPIEFFIAFISPHRRLGDLISRTKLISTDKKSASQRMRSFKIEELTMPKIKGFLMAIGIAFLSFQILNYLISTL